MRPPCRGRRCPRGSTTFSSICLHEQEGAPMRRFLIRPALLPFCARNGRRCGATATTIAHDGRVAADAALSVRLRSSTPIPAICRRACSPRIIRSTRAPSKRRWSTPVTSICPQFGTEREAEQALARGEVLFVLHIPPSFVARRRSGLRNRAILTGCRRHGPVAIGNATRRVAALNARRPRPRPAAESPGDSRVARHFRWCSRALQS